MDLLADPVYEAMFSARQVFGLTKNDGPLPDDLVIQHLLPEELQKFAQDYVDFMRD